MVTVQKSAVQRLWKCFVLFSRKTGEPITMTLLFLFYTSVKMLYATGNCHMYFEKKMVAVENPLLVLL